MWVKRCPSNFSIQGVADKLLLLDLSDGTNQGTMDLDIFNLPNVEISKGLIILFKDGCYWLWYANLTLFVCLWNWELSPRIFLNSIFTSFGWEVNTGVPYHVCTFESWFSPHTTWSWGANSGWQVEWQEPLSPEQFLQPRA